MQQLYDLMLKQGLRPFTFFTDTSHIEQKVTRSDLTTLLILLFRGGMTMSELAGEMGAPLSSMTSIAKRLERKGYITRTTSAQDQRVKLVTLTREGSVLAQECQQIMQTALLRVEEALTPEELEQFIGLVLKITRVFQEGGSQQTRDAKPEAPRKIDIEE